MPIIIYNISKDFYTKLNWNPFDDSVIIEVFDTRHNTDNAIWGCVLSQDKQLYKYTSYLWSTWYKGGLLIWFRSDVSIHATELQWFHSSGFSAQFFYARHILKSARKIRQC